MKTAAFAIALLLSGAAFAQSTTTTTTQPDVDVDVGVQPDGDPDVDLDVGTKTKTTTHHADGTVVTSTTDNVGDDAGTTETKVTTDGTTTTHGTMTHGTTTVATNVTPPMNPVVQPSNAAPERDARGIPVISDPAVVPAGFNGTSGAGVGGPLVDPATGKTVTGADASHPPCTATVTDNCVQTYEKGRRR
ncbi:MAG TPA: hypothetical protein VEA61_07770 [Allosphingosinicella sp.]|nr:hypothetical protein [Allosphingosinicella sp.]